MTKAFFITGTDTDVGKTYVSTLLVKGFREQGYKVSGFKPVAAGGHWQDGDFQNEDAEALMQEASVKLPYNLVNPYCFEPAIAPHIAAERIGVNIDTAKIQSAYEKHIASAEVVVIEGAGGWRVPLGQGKGFDDLALELDAPVVLVVGLKLGCLNHALLTESAILNKGCRLVGWVANEQTAGFDERDENLNALKLSMKSSYLGLIEHQLEGLSAQRKLKSLLDYLAEFR